MSLTENSESYGRRQCRACVRRRAAVDCAVVVRPSDDAQSTRTDHIAAQRCRRRAVGDERVLVALPADSVAPHPGRARQHHHVPGRHRSVLVVPADERRRRISCTNNTNQPLVHIIAPTAVLIKTLQSRADFHSDGKKKNAARTSSFHLLPKMDSQSRRIASESRHNAAIDS